MHIDTSSLVAALKEAPETKGTSCREVSDYVMEHIFTPLRRDEPVLFAGLDFDAFTDEDIEALGRWIRERDHISRRLDDLMMIFRQAKPISRTGRAFC